MNLQNKRLFKSIIICLFTAGALGTLTGCGEKKIDVIETVTLKYSGANGFGTAETENAYNWETKAFESMGIKEINSFSDLETGLRIETAVSYEIYPKENLSNGDEVTVKAVYDNEAVKEYGIKFIGEEKKFIVEGLQDVKYIDLFEYIEIEFQGISPYVTARIVDTSDQPDSIVRVSYTIDKNTDIMVSDIITVTAQYDKEKLLASGYMAKSDTKEFQVSGVAKYISAFEEIDQAAWGYMETECENLLEAKVATDDNYYNLLSKAASNDKDSELFNYYLSAYNALKWGTNAEPLKYEKPVYELKYLYLYNIKNLNMWTSSKNVLTFVYVVHIKDNVVGEKDVYIPISFSNVLQNEDGSNYIDISTRELKNLGFNYETVYNKIVNANKADWNILEKNWEK